MINLPTEEASPRHDIQIENSFVKKIALCGKEIISNPKDNLLNIMYIFDQFEMFPEVVMLTILKIFLDIVPLYKIKMLTNEVKDKKRVSNLTKWEQDLIMLYSKYISLVIRKDDEINYRCATELLSKLNHFNYVDKLISFILKGTLSENNTCCECLSGIFKTNNLELIYKILIQMCNLCFGKGVLSYCLDIDIFEFQIVKDKFYTGFIYENVKLKNNKHSDKNLIMQDKENVMSKKIKKQEKLRSEIDRESSKNENTNEQEETKKLELKICNTLLRIYLLILENKKSEFYDDALIGLRKFKVIVKDNLVEGTRILIMNIMENATLQTKFLGILTILELYENKTVDLNKVRDYFYEIIQSQQLKLKKQDEKLVAKALKCLFLKDRLAQSEVIKFLRSLMVLCVLNYLPRVSNIITKTIEYYEIEDECTACNEYGAYIKMFY